MEIISWNLINESTIDSRSGIYTWFYKPMISDFDINQLLLSLDNSDNKENNLNKIIGFLDKHLFSCFREEDYSVELKGKLMPTFRGSVSHVDHTSLSLADSIDNDRDVIWQLKSALDLVPLYYSSPIYIGMSDNLKQRILTHKYLIEKYKSEGVRVDTTATNDESFAARVVARGMIEFNLKVSVYYIDTDVNAALENILNRINYPVLGRN